MTRPRASVVIPVLNGMPRLKECLEAIARQRLSGGFEIIVVDSGSTDGSAEIAESYARVIRIPRAEFNHGLTRNLAVAEARGEFVALIVQDATPVDDQWLRSLVEAFADQSVAGVYSRQIPREDCPPLIRARLERWSASRGTRVVKRVESEEAIRLLPELEQVALLSFDNVSSCIRRSVWERVPFEERPFGEDIRWAKAVMLLGYSLVFEPASAVIHSHNNSMWYEFKRVYLDHQNWNQMIGLALFKRFSEVWQAGVNGIPVRWREIDEQDMAPGPRIYWKLYAMPYSFSQNLAQYLGSRSSRWITAWPRLGRIDSRLRKGV